MRQSARAHDQSAVCERWTDLVALLEEVCPRASFPHVGLFTLTRPVVTALLTLKEEGQHQIQEQDKTLSLKGWWCTRWSLT